MSLTRFLLILFILSAILGLAASFIEANDPDNVILVPKFWVLFGFLVMITIIAYIVSMIGIKKGGENSIFVIMGVTTLKLLLCMSLVLVYSLKYKVNSVVFATEFFSLYFSFTAFEVYALLCNLRHQNKT